MLVDIVMDEAPETAVVEQEEFEKLGEVSQVILANRPDMAGSVTEMMIQASQLRDKNKILEKLREPQPGAEEAQQQQQAQLQAQMAELQAQVAVLQSQAQLNQAKAQQTMVEAQLEPEKVASEIEKNQAAAMVDATSAGEKTGGVI